MNEWINKDNRIKHYKWKVIDNEKKVKKRVNERKEGMKEEKVIETNRKNICIDTEKTKKQWVEN